LINLEAVPMSLYDETCRQNYNI